MPTATVQAPDGRIVTLEVPPGATEQDIHNFLSSQDLSQFDSPPAPTETHPSPSEDGGLLDRAKQFAADQVAKKIGQTEALGTFATGMLAEPVSGLAGVAAGLGAAVVPGGRTGAEAAGQTVRDVQDAMTYQPRTEAGRRELEGAAEVLTPVAEVLESVETGLGDAAYNATGSPAAASAATAIPTALSELLGVVIARGGARAAQKAKAIARAAPDERTASILSAADKAGVPVLTTDLFPPQSYLGKMLQTISDKLGPLGSGNTRAKQQAARVDAAAGIAEHIDIDTPFADTMVKSLNKKSVTQLKNAGAIRNDAVSKLDEFGEFDAVQAVEKIDELLEKQARLGATANSALSKELQAFRGELASGTDFSLKKDLRTQLIKKVKAFERSEDVAPAVDLQQVKSALDKDMVSFARARDRKATRDWLHSNRKFADELERTKRTELKRVLQSGDATPEKIIPILKGGKPSELRRLHTALGQKGRDAAKGALMQQALKDAGFFKVDLAPNPDALATALNRPSFQQASNVFFKGADKAELDGMVRMLDATRKAQSGQTVLKTGEQLLLPGGAGAVGAGVAGGILPAAPTAAAIAIGSVLAKAYESKTFRNLLVKLSQAKKRSRVESRILDAMAPALGAAYQAPKTVQEQER